MDSDLPRRKVRDLPARSLTVQVWHHCPPDVSLLSVADPPLAQGRYHRKHGPPVWYASSHERGAWAEYFRHLMDAVNPFHQRRRIGRAAVEDLRVLDLTAPKVRESLGVKDADLRDDDTTLCQGLADEARGAGLDGVLTLRRR